MARYFRVLILALSLFALSALANAQTTPAQKESPTKRAAGRGKASTRVEPGADTGRRAIAISLLTSLADEAKSYQEQTLRARVQARAADALWETDGEKARTLFRRAWESADTADRESLRHVENEKQRMSETRTSGYINGPSELRSEVLRLAARRDRALGEEFLAKLSEAVEKDSTGVSGISSSSAPTQASQNPEQPPLAIGQRLSLARQLLQDGDTALALQFADKALDRVTTHGINFLSLLREKDAAAADQRFLALLGRAAADPSSDAVTVSVLSSYTFTPFLYVIVARDYNHSSQQRDRIVAPNISPALRTAFFQAAAQILLRPIPQPDQDRTFAGRPGLYFTIARLLPLFNQYEPDLASQLNAQLAALSSDAPERFRNNSKDAYLTRGLVPEEEMRDEAQAALEGAERAATQAERDLLYARAALVAARKGETRARDLTDKIDDTEMRKRARAFVDFTLVGQALNRKDATESLRLIRTGDLTNVQRTYALTQAARLMKDADPTRAEEILNEALAEARRIGGSDPDRARALTGVATSMYDIDRTRVWEILSEAIKAANSASAFTGEDAQIVARFETPRGASTTNFGVESFDLGGIFASLAREDLYRAVEVAKNFQSDAPRATATLAIARAVLEKR